MNWTRYFSLTAAAFLTLLLAGCIEENVTPLQIGAKAPPSTLTLLNGQTRQVNEHAGRAQVITFMSSWCPCSNDSIPLMKEAFARHGKDGEGDIAFLMIGFQSPESKFADIAAKWKMPFPVGYDDGDEIARIYGIKAPPTTVFIDAEGNVKRVFYGNIKDIGEDFFKWTSELL
jgi:peroxiredoxin